MIKRLNGLIFSLFSLCYAAEEQYQDVVINNVVVMQGVRECGTRYEALKPLLNKFKRAFTFLDIGAESGYFSFKTAHDYPDAVGIMIEDGYSDDWHTGQKLLELCRNNTDLTNIVFLRRRMTVDDLERLADCEHFDVVYAFNIIHHFGKDWHRAADAIFKLGDHTIIESPPSNDKVFAQNHEIRELEKYLAEKEGKIIAWTPRHTDPNALSLMIHFETPKTELMYKHWFFGSTSVDGLVSYKICSDFTKKIFIKNTQGKTIERDWYPGINFITFKTLSGVWPSKKAIGRELLKFGHISHGDLLPWNIIVTGNVLKTIDDDGEYSYDSLQSLLYTYAFAFLNTYDEVCDYVLNELYNRYYTRALLSPVSYGELFDKITILEIKKRKTTNAEKLLNIENELMLLHNIRDKNIPTSEILTQLTQRLAAINEKLWDIEDRVREKERAQSFDSEFIALARSVYKYNDQRATIKREINELLKSDIIEEKIYEQY